MNRTSSACVLDRLESRTLLSGSGSISGTIYADVNGSYFRDDGENGLANRRVYIDANANGSFDIGETSVQTDVNGSYQFTGLAAGNYTIRTELHNENRRTVPVGGAFHVNLFAGANVQGRDFGVTSRSMVSGRIFNDTNNNGKMDPGESSLVGVRVHLDVNNNNQWDPGENYCLTNADGMYFLNTPISGTVKVRIDTPDERVCTQSHSGIRQIALSAGASFFGQNGALALQFNTDIDIQPGDDNGTISGHVTASLLNLLGVVGLEGRTVYIDVNNNNECDPGEISVQTNVDGFFQFTNLPAGNYIIRHVANSEILYTLPQLGSYAVNLLANQNVPNCNFSLSSLFDVLLDPDDSILEANVLGAVNQGLTVANHTVRGADVDVFAFTVGAGVTIDFEKSCYGNNPEAVKLRIFNFLGLELANDLNTTGVLSHTFTLGGTYYVAVSANGNTSYNILTGLLDTLGLGGNITGEYSLTLTPRA